MRRIKTLVFFLGFLVFMSVLSDHCLAITIQQQWSKQFSDMIIYRMSADRSRIGLINTDEYLILNQKGEVIKRGKNQKYRDIAVSEDLFVLSGSKTRVFDYSGKQVWEVPYPAYPYFSPLGNYLMLWEEDGDIHMYTKKGEKIIDFPVGTEECEFSKDEDYLLVPLSGLYRISNGTISKIVSAQDALFEAEYLKNSKNVAIVYQDDNMEESLRMYNPSGKILWKRTLKKYRFLKRFDNNLLLMEDYTLRFLDYNGNVKYNLIFQKQKFSGFESTELNSRNLFLLKGYDSNGSYLYFINQKGQILYKHILPPFMEININEKSDLFYSMTSSNDEQAILTLKCYRIIY